MRAAPGEPQQLARGGLQPCFRRASCLLRATPEERPHFEIGRFGIHWPKIDEDIELAGLLPGAKTPDAKPLVDA
jgi:hypothetical protein